jgi:Primase X
LDISFASRFKFYLDNELILFLHHHTNRKNATYIIGAPYLVNIKKLPYTNAFDIIKDWLNRCGSLRRLDSNFNYRIKSALEDAMQKGIPPMSLSKLREKNRGLHDLLSLKMHSSDYQRSEK